MTKTEAAKRVFGFSYDERVYSSDVDKIVAAAREFPSAKVFVHEPSWTAEDQTFVLAETPKEAMEILIAYYGKDVSKEEIDKMKESDFHTTET